MSGRGVYATRPLVLKEEGYRTPHSACPAARCAAGEPSVGCGAGARGERSEPLAQARGGGACRRSKTRQLALQGEPLMRGGAHLAFALAHLARGRTLGDGALELLEAGVG